MSDELTPLTQTIARLAAPVPKPRVNLTRYRGVFAPNCRHHVLVTPAKQEEAGCVSFYGVAGILVGRKKSIRSLANYFQQSSPALVTLNLSGHGGSGYRAEKELTPLDIAVHCD